jgi:hypothetical protein
VNLENRLEQSEQVRGIAGHDGGGDFGSGNFLDTHIVILPSGKMRLTWTRPQETQAEPLAGAECDDIESNVRFFTRDDRKPEDARVPANILFRRAISKIQGWCAAAIDDKHISSQDLELRRELLAERAAADEREREELLSLGIDPSEVEHAFSEVAG